MDFPMGLPNWPIWLDDVWAKSADRGAEGRPETLAQHTFHVLARLSDFMHLRPQLPAMLGQPRLWHILFWGAFLHDFGKATAGFQAQLRQGPRWGHRHEVLSLAFVDWVAAGFSTQELPWLAAAIASHHKDAAEVRQLYREPDDPDDDQLIGKVAELNRQTLDGLWLWLDQFGANWIERLGLTEVGVQMVTLDQQQMAVKLVQQQGAKRIYIWLRAFSKLSHELESERDERRIAAGLALRGHIINSDHSASAHVTGLPHLVLTRESIEISCQLTPERLYTHQRVAGATLGSALLTAPTGTGKTEAGLLWAAQQAESEGGLPRLFYTLPYQASMNAMKLRLDRSFGDKMVGLQHGRGLLALYRLLLARGYGAEAAQEARWARNLALLNYPPVRIFSPYQMLKGMYRLKGYEALLTDYHGAAFIFDEIHAYEVKRLAMILSTTSYLRRNYNARFLVMSATFPTIVKGWLRDALGAPTEIVAAPEIFRSFRRHRLEVVDGDLLDEENLHHIAADAEAGKSVLVVCNLVARSQFAYTWLSRRLSHLHIPIVLLHGRFNMRDRSQKEALVRQALGSGRAERQPVVLIATQVVEVSLDIDLDTIYTDPAPLEALVQRFGRINRRRALSQLAPVHVYRQPNDGQKIYNPELVSRTLQILERESGRPVDENAIGCWLDEIYAGAIAEQWQDQYAVAEREFNASCVQTLRPFASDDKLEELFYQAFDSIEILPNALYDEYLRLQTSDPILAAELLVPIRWGSYCGLQGKGLILPAEKEGPRKLRLPPIALADYSEELGLTNERTLATDYD